MFAPADVRAREAAERHRYLKGTGLPVMEILSVEQVGFTPFYDSRWGIRFRTPEGARTVRLTRDDSESKDRLFCGLKSCFYEGDILALDRRDFIYYD